jgi:N-acetylglucosaminyl-diphospho-decaprenol L-rhamnosyltransferase
MTRCSVIIVTYNSGRHIEACLRALAAQDCEILVVDNASQDDTVACVKALAEVVRLELITISRNIGFAAGVNQGARASGGEVVVLLNPDAVAEPHAIDALLECVATSGAAAVGGALLASDGGVAQGFVFRRLPTLVSLLCEVLLVNQLWPGNPVNRRYRCLDADTSVPQEVEQPAGACLAVRRTVWDQLQGMDAAFYPVWFEDVDFCARLREAGEKIWYCPEARFHHSGAHSVGELNFADKQSFWYENMLRYARKHFATWQVLILRMGIVLGMGLRMLASLLGRKPPDVSLGDALRGYAHAASLAFLSVKERGVRP